MMFSGQPQLALGKCSSLVNLALAEMDRDRVVERIWGMDHTVWKPAPDEITNRLGWLRSVGHMREEIDRLQSLSTTLREQGYRRAVLLGMGGSSLAPEVFSKVFGAKGRGLDLAVVDTTAPDAVSALAERLDLPSTVFIVATKSGGTVEVLSLFKYFYTQVSAAVGAGRAGEHFLAITDPGSKIVDLARQFGFRDTFLNDPNIGGRYSVLSFFGLMPAALIGVHLGRLLDAAQAAAVACREDAAARNPGALLGTALGELAKAGRDKLTVHLSPSIAPFGDWVEQLVAESTGKEGKGILPVVGEPLDDPQAYGDDRVFVDLRLEGDETREQALRTLETAGHPVVRLALVGVYDLGGQFFLWEMATAVAAHRLGVNPFDQPDVESAKVLARKKMEEYQRLGVPPAEAASPPSGAALARFLSGADPSGYVALQAYVQPTPETDAALADLRYQVRRRSGLATTVGYGPRYLHSTGQLHKGDAGRGLFVQFTGDSGRDVPIPDEAGSPASSISFGVLQRAQAMGDRQALAAAGRRVIHFDLRGSVVPGLRRLVSELG